jgi:hypothetical protein
MEETRWRSLTRWVTVERSAETFLIEMMADETNTAAENKESIEGADLWNDEYEITDKVLRLTLIYSSASSGVKAPLSRSKSTKETAMHPSTFRMSLEDIGVSGMKVARYKIPL